MNDTQRYLFDLQGYLHLPGFLARDQTEKLYAAAQSLEQDALSVRSIGKQFTPKWKGRPYWQHPKLGYFASGETAPGDTMLVEDFWLFPDAFDFLIGHEPTMKIVARTVRGKITINNSELRIRYTGNHTGMHMGFSGGTGSKYRYRVLNGEVDCVMVRMVYFLHDVSADEGAICFVPGSHKAEFVEPVNTAVDQEPGVVPIPVKAGDAVFFTEACRHGGFPNRSSRTRHTLHVGYGPDYLHSQNISTMDEWPNVTPALLERLNADQRTLLVPQLRVPL